MVHSNPEMKKRAEPTIDYGMSMYKSMMIKIKQINAGYSLSPSLSMISKQDNVYLVIYFDVRFWVYTRCSCLRIILLSNPSQTT